MGMNAKELRRRAKITRQRIAEADAKMLAEMTPQQRQIYKAEQDSAYRLHVDAEARNRRYEGMGEE